jgi:hypothetical protein
MIMEQWSNNNYHGSIELKTCRSADYSTVNPYALLGINAGFSLQEPGDKHYLWHGVCKVN